MASVIPDLSVRERQPEMMDSPELGRDQHEEALRGLARVNTLSRVASRIWRVLKGIPLPEGRSLRLLDVACGGGDVALALKGKAVAAGIPLEVAGCDISPVALECARGLSQARGLEARFFQHDALADELPGGFDLVTSSLFLHHLPSGDAKGFLRSLAGAGRRVLVQDLLRSRLGYSLAWATVRLISRSPVMHVDGPLSVRSAFTLPEIRDLAEEAGLNNSRIRWCWPERFELYWETRP